MKVTYDKKTNAMYIALLPMWPGCVANTEEVTEDLLIDRYEDGRICGIDISNVEFEDVASKMGGVKGK